MSTIDREPLNPDERELADRLRRLPAADGPPAALDARILASARAAASPAATVHPRRRRRLAAWLPGGAITAVGTAAAFAIAIGTAWQLRPIDRPAAPSGTGGDDGVVVVELLAPRDDGTLPADAASAPRTPRGGEWAAKSPAARDVERAADEDPHPVASAAAHGVPSAAASAPVARSSADAPPSAATNSPPAATAPFDTAVLEPAAPAAVTPSAEVQAADVSDRPRRATYTTAARARAESSGTRPRAYSRADRAAPPMDLGSVPIEEDAGLPREEWLERIRARHDAGDADAARTSLKRFMQVHPRTRLPRDLRALAR